MDQNVLDGTQLAQMMLAGYHCLQENKQHVNALNVFPVPDGDTGTNMSMSLASGVEEMMKYKGTEVSKTANALATGLLMGARGNSGVILSQLLRGFAQAVAQYKEIDGKILAHALQNGVQTAYRAVVKPVEGTILTVAREAAQEAQKAAKSKQVSIRTVLEALLRGAEGSLARTPDQLPALRQAGVVDSGGQGLVYIYKGFLAAITGQTVTNGAKAEAESSGEAVSHKMEFAPAFNPDHHTDEFGYCTEFIIRLKAQNLTEEQAEQEVRQALLPYGNSMLVAAVNHLVKVHIHAMRPGQVLERAMDFGSLIKIKIDNMTEQHEGLSHGNATENQEVVAGTPVKPYGFVTVASGEGIIEVFRSLGVTQIIEGGQTMNPSTEDIVNAVKRANAEHVFVLPNNSNIIMAAEQAKSMVPNRLTVIPSKTVPQGIAALLAFHEEGSMEENEAIMTQALHRVKSASITQAVRNSQFQGFEIHEGDYMGLLEGKVVVTGQELEWTAQQLLLKVVDQKDEIVTVFYGKDVIQGEGEALMEKLSQTITWCEFELQWGGQPLYSYIFSIE